MAYCASDGCISIETCWSGAKSVPMAVDYGRSMRHAVLYCSMGVRLPSGLHNWSK